jgi:hypothetical protein
MDGGGGDLGAPVASNSRGQITSKLTIPRSTSVAPVLEFLRAPRARLITWLPVGKLPSAAPTKPEGRECHGPCKDGAQKFASLFGTLYMPNLDRP